MMQPMKKLKPVQPYLDYGVVTEVEDAGFTVATPYGCVEAQAALSCLVRPEKGDDVLLSTNEEGRCFILSILVRKEKAQQPIQVVFPSAVQVRTREGGLSVAIPGEVTVRSEKRISAMSRAFSIHAREGEICVERLSFLAKWVTAHMEKIRMFGETLETTVKKLIQRAKSCFRFVEGHEDIRTGSARYIIKDTFHVRSGHSLHVAKGQMKLDADQIHLG